MKFKICLSLLIILLGYSNVNSQIREQDSTYKKFFIGSSLFVLANLVPDQPNPPSFYQLNFGYRLTPKDVISIEAITWTYAWPNGIPWGKSFEAPEEKYPGSIKEVGLALAYQRFFWKGAYGAVHAFNAKQTYLDENDNKIQNGYRLFMTYRVGYHLQFFKNTLFLEPSVAVTHWPVDTNVPTSFATVENKWSNYFLFEPGLHFGIKF
jgi:hypothetical protein